MKNYTFTREATAEEIRDYELVEERTKDMDDGEFAEIVDMLGEYFLSYGAERKAAYNKVYRFAKKHQTDIRTAGLKLIETDAWAEAESLFGGENA